MLSLRSNSVQFITRPDSQQEMPDAELSSGFEMPSLEPMPAGWALLRGMLHREDLSISLRLSAVTRNEAGEIAVFPIAVSRKGTIFELLYLPNGIVTLRLEPFRPVGFELKNLSITPVSQFERIVRMYRRVIPMLFKQPRSRRQKAGLKAYTPFLNLHKAYRIASQLRDYTPERSYEKWILEHNALADNDRRQIRRHFKSWRKRPHFKIFIVVREDPAQGLRRSLEALHGQLYRNFSVTLLIHPKAKLNLKLVEIPAWMNIYKASSAKDLVQFVRSRVSEAEDPSWVICVHEGVLLAEHALYWLACEALSNDEATFVYADHDILSENGDRDNPVFKPDWSLELLRSTNYIGCSAAIRSDVLVKSGGISWSDIKDGGNHDLYLRLSERLVGKAARHIPAILWHLPPTTGRQQEDTARAKLNPVARHLLRLGVAATVQEPSAGCYRVRYELPDNPPKVSVVVPTRDMLTHLRACVESVLEKSSYRNFELLVIDNQSSQPETLAYLSEIERHPQVRVLRYNRPFNYSAINNFAIKRSVGEVVCLLNNDTEVISCDWMEEMLGHLLQSAVGAVGAKLYYSDGRVQHAGDAVGPGGCADHMHSMIEKDDPGYCNRAILAQDLSAVTAACLMTSRKLFTELGGLNAKNLPVSFNDVDYCLRVRAKGLRVIWTPHAELYHHESISRGKNLTEEQVLKTKREADYMRRRWKHLMSHDPFYNPNLSYDRPDFSLNTAPIIKRPWRR